MRHNRSKMVLVVGASSGIGEAAAAELVRRGHRVFGTSRDAARVTVPGVVPLEMEVTSDHSVEQSVDSVLERGNGRIDAMVYSAGHYVAGAAEETTVEQVREEFDVYVVGAHRVTRAVLPSMRTERFGRLVYMSSSAGAAGVPFHAVYSATKAAVERYAEGLSYEVEPFGLSVSYIQASGVKTGAASAYRKGAEPNDVYEPYRARAVARFAQAQREGLEPLAVARTIARAIESKRPWLSYRVGWQARSLPWVQAWFPEGFLRHQMKRFFGTSGQTP